MSLHEVRLRLKEYKKKCNYFRKHGHRYRRRHLCTRLKIAKSSGDEMAEARILAIIEREKQRSYWRRLNYAMSRPKGRSARIVTEETGDGNVREFGGQSAVEQAIWDGIHNQRFYLAEQAPICQGPMREAFGYLATTIAARQIWRTRTTTQPGLMRRRKNSAKPVQKSGYEFQRDLWIPLCDMASGLNVGPRLEKRLHPQNLASTLGITKLQHDPQ